MIWKIGGRYAENVWYVFKRLVRIAMNEDESTLLHPAAQEGDAEAITGLVDAGADLNAQEPFLPPTPL